MGHLRCSRSADEPTSTYAYNGLLPLACQDARLGLRHRPSTLAHPSPTSTAPTDLLVFADALLGVSDPPKSTALLDPPKLFKNGAWQPNPYPTTAFRHAHAALSAGADASVSMSKPALLAQPDLGIGSLDLDHYVPDWRNWTK